NAAREIPSAGEEGAGVVVHAAKASVAMQRGASLISATAVFEWLNLGRTGTLVALHQGHGYLPTEQRSMRYEPSANDRSDRPRERLHCRARPIRWIDAKGVARLRRCR